MNRNVLKAIMLLLIILIIGVVVYISMTQNSSNTNQVQEENLSNTNSTTSENQKILIAYFSQTGNTELMAQEIQSQIGGDLFKIERAEDYPSGYTELTQVAQAEIEKRRKTRA